jgi:hypothetical protein
MDPEFNKYKSDFLYYYGKYKSQIFLKNLGYKKVSNSEIKEDEDNAKKSLYNMLENNYDE